MEVYRIFADELENYEAIYERFGGMMHIWEKYIYSFENDETYGELAKAMEEKSLVEVREKSHKLKGVAYNIGFVRLGEAVGRLNEYAKQQCNWDKIIEAFNEVKENYNRIKLFNERIALAIPES